MNGARLLLVDRVATVGLGVVLALGVAFPDTLGIVAAGWSLVLFVIGCGTFLVAFAVAVERSRTEAIGIGGLYFLAGTAPSTVRRSFLVLLGAQCVLSLAAASARPFTSLAFGVLAPMAGLGLQGLWVARHGEFEARDPGVHP